MLTKRIIPCLDVKDGAVVKGVQFKNHEIVGDILALTERYVLEGADELVFYDITASADGKTISNQWVADVAKLINIPFCVAGGIKSVKDAAKRLECGADKISINSPALANPKLIDEMVKTFGSQCIVVGIDSMAEGEDYNVYQYTGRSTTSVSSNRTTIDWAKEVAERGAGEIVLNCMNMDGVRKGYDIAQLNKVKNMVNIPVIASGGAGVREDFLDVFTKTNVDGALAASVFHKKIIEITELKQWLADQGQIMRN